MAFIPPFVSNFVNVPCSNGRRVGPMAGWMPTNFWTPINLSMQGVAAYVDATENDTAYMLRVDLPGFSAEDVDIQVQGDKLSISANNKANQGKGRVAFSRTFALPEDVKEDDISASLDKGVLTVVLPKAEPASKPAPKRFAVQAGPAAAAGGSKEESKAAGQEEKCAYRGWGRCKC